MKIFTLAIAAYQLTQEQYTFQIKSLAMLAASEIEAVGRALKEAQREWPSQAGWGGHNYSIAEISKEFIKKALEPKP